MGLKIEMELADSIKSVAAAIAIIDATAFFLESSYFISFYGVTTTYSKTTFFFFQYICIKSCSATNLSFTPLLKKPSLFRGFNSWCPPPSVVGTTSYVLDVTVSL